VSLPVSTPLLFACFPVSTGGSEEVGGACVKQEGLFQGRGCACVTVSQVFLRQVVSFATTLCDRDGDFTNIVACSAAL
jgi:hypothetical protein